jgi:septum site-determining protein MinD
VEAFEKGHPRLVLNRIKPRMVSRGEMMSIEDVLQILAIDLIGVVPDDESIVTATNRGEVAVLDRASRAGRAYIDIARRLTGEQVPFMALDDNQGMLDRFFELLGLRQRGSAR